MPSRPKIPVEIEREILLECGHRCAVCGTPTPLERAHIIPWHKSREHKAEDMICLCANCHERAEKEKWSEKMLREYKQKPWVMRQYERLDNTPGPTTKVNLTIDIEIKNFDEKIKKWLQHGLAAFLEISPKDVQITSIEKGNSVKVTIELPKKSAQKLLNVYKRNDSELVKYLDPLILLGIHQGVDSFVKMSLVEDIKKADYYHLLGDNLRAKEVIEGFQPTKEWERKLKESLEKFYQGMAKTLGNTQSLIDGVNEINESIKEFNKLLNWDKICNKVRGLSIKKGMTERENKYYEALKSKLEKIKEQFNELQSQSNSPRDSTNDLLPLIIKEIAVIDLWNIKRKYWHRIKEFKKLKIEEPAPWKTEEQIEQEVEPEVKKLFESVGSDRDSDKYLKEAEAVFSLAILATKGYLRGMDKMKDEYMEIMSYIRRGFTLYLQEKHRQGFNDYIAANDLLLNIGSQNEIFGYLSIFINILKGDLYYDLYNHERAFDCCCDAMREWERYKEEWEKYKDKSNEIYKEIGRSYRIAEAMINKSKIFFEKGKFRDSLIWSFQSLWILLNILKEKKSQGTNENIGKINEIISELKKMKDKYDIIPKEKVGNLLKGISPCSLIHPLKEDFAILSSIAFNQIGFTGYTLKLDYLKILPECAN